MSDKFVVRFYDGFGHEWMDVFGPVPKEEADRIWDEKTLNGTIFTQFNDIDYYRVFNADTLMIYRANDGESAGEL